MAFVLPAGDYERALRMAGASNFMEALESGIDRGMQRQAMRERAARARDLYNRQVASQQADLMGDLLEIDSAGFTAGQPTTGAPSTGQAVAVSPTTGQVIAAEGASVADAPRADAPRAAASSPTAAALAEAVSPAPSQDGYSMPADRRAIHDRMRANRMARRKQPPVGTVTTDDQMVMRIKRKPVTSALERGLPASEFALATPRGPRVLDDPNPDMYEILRAPYVVDTASLPPQEFALATPRQSEQLAEALRLAEQGRTVEAQEVLGATGTAYPPLDVETATEGPSIPFEAGQDALPEEAPAAPAEGGDGVVGLPTGGPGAFATQAAGVTAALSDDPVLAAARALQAGLPQEVARAQEQRRLQGIEENALGAGSMAPGDLGFGATPGTPLEQAVSTQAAVAEEVELAGPEPEAVKADQTVDVAGKVYTVKKGDTLGRVSSSFGAPLASVVAANQDVLAPGGKPRQIKRGEKVLLEGQDLIYPGDRIRIPTGEGRETGGEAGPVDPRPVTTVAGPGGQVTSSEGVLARVQRANKTNAQVKTALEREQRKTPDLPLNPFQKFGRAIDYTPTLQAVAFATLRAQQGDFTMLNQLAGRQVRNSEIPGLFAEYSEFVRGAKGRAKEVYLQQELLKETQANEAKLRALTGVKAMALTQFRRAGYSDEDAQIFAGHYADLYAADPQQARAWSTSLNSMGTDRAKAEAARLKRSGFGRGGFSSKDINKAYNIVDKAQGRLTSAVKALSGVLAPGGYPLPLEEMKKAATENPALIASMQNYERALKTYNNAEKRLNQMLNEGLPEGPSVSLDKLLEQYGDSKVMKREVAKARRGEISWDGFEAELSKVVGAKGAEALAEHYKATEAKDEPEAEDAPEAEVAAPPAAARTAAEIERELADVKAKPPASRREEQTQRSRAARLRQELSRETRAASARKIREGLIAKSNRVTGDAEDMLIRVNAGEAVPSSDRQSAVSSLKSLLSDLEKFESQGAEEGGSVGLNPFDNRVGIIALRRGVPVSEDIEDVKFLIKRLSR